MSAKDEDEMAKRCFNEGMIASNAGDHVAASEAFTEGLRTSKSVELQSALYVSRCGALQSMGRWEDALKDAIECQKLRPSWSRTFECRAACLDGMGRRKEADASRSLSEGLAALKQDPKNEEMRQKVRAMRQEMADLQASESPPAAQPAKNAASSSPPTPSPPISTVSAPAATAGDEKPQAESEEATNMFAVGTHAAKVGDNGGAYDNFSRSLLIARTVELKSAILVSRSAILCSMLRWEEALADADECILIRKSWARSYACQATALHGLGRAEEADRAKRLSVSLAELKQEPKNEELKLAVRTIRQEMAQYALQMEASEKRAPAAEVSAAPPESLPALAKAAPAAQRSAPLPDAAPSPLPSSPGTAPSLIALEAKPVQILIKLGLASSAAGLPGSSQRVAFIDNLTKDLAQASDLPVTQFEIRMVHTQFGLSIDAVIHPNSAGLGPNPMMVAMDLDRQTRDHNSRLFSGVVTRHVQELTLVDSPAQVLAPAPNEKAAVTESLSISKVWQLRLGLIKAQNLPKKNLMENSDSFVTFDMTGQKQQKSKTIKNTLNPEWNEEFVFDVYDEKQELVLKVWDWDAVKQKQTDEIGEVRLNLAELSEALAAFLVLGKSNLRTINIMKHGRHVIGKDSEKATVTLFLSASNKMNGGSEAASVGVTEVDPTAQQPIDAMVGCTMLFDCDYRTVMQREELIKCQLRQDLAVALNVSAERFSTPKLEAGRLVANFNILPVMGTAAVSSSFFVDDMSASRPCASLMKELMEQANDVRSPLRQQPLTSCMAKVSAQPAPHPAVPEARDHAAIPKDDFIRMSSAYIFLRVTCARALPLVGGRPPNVFVEAQVGDLRKHSRIVASSDAPTFDWLARFPVYPDLNDPSTVVHVQLMDMEEALHGRMMGVTTFTVSGLRKNWLDNSLNEGWFPLLREGISATQGAVKMRIEYVPSHKEQAEEHKIKSTPTQNMAQGSTGFDDNEAEELLKTGNLCQLNEDFPGALGLYTKALTLARNADLKLSIFHNRSVALGKMSRWDEALQCASECVRIDPNGFRGIVAQGDALTGLGRLSEALEAFEAAQALDPQNQMVNRMVEDLKLCIAEPRRPWQRSVTALPHVPASVRNDSALPQLVKSSAPKCNVHSFVQLYLPEPNTNGAPAIVKWNVSGCNTNRGKISLRTIFPNFPHSCPLPAGATPEQIAGLAHTVHIQDILSEVASDSAGTGLTLIIPPPSECRSIKVSAVVLRRCQGLTVFMDNIQDQVWVKGCTDVNFVVGHELPKTGIYFIDCHRCKLVVSSHVMKNNNIDASVKCSASSEIFLLLLSSSAGLGFVDLATLWQADRGVEQILLPDQFTTVFKEGAIATRCTFSIDGAQSFQHPALPLLAPSHAPELPPHHNPEWWSHQRSNSRNYVDQLNSDWRSAAPALDIAPTSPSVPPHVIHQPNASPKPGGDEILVSLTLDMDMREINAEEFNREVAHDVAQALGTSITRIRTVAISSGKGIVDLAILNTGDMSSAQLVHNLNTQLGDPYSPLMRGRHTRGTIAVREGHQRTLMHNGTVEIPRSAVVTHSLNGSPQYDAAPAAPVAGQVARAGIGLGLTRGTGLVYTVCGLTPGGAAEASGQLQRGDVVHSIDGMLMTGKTLAEIQDLVLGEVGTKVMVAVLRSDAAPEDLKLELHEFDRWRPVILIRSFAAQQPLQKPGQKYVPSGGGASFRVADLQQPTSSSVRSDRSLWPSRNGVEVIAVDLVVDDFFAEIAPTVALKTAFMEQLREDICMVLKVAPRQVIVVDLLTHPDSVVAVVEFYPSSDLEAKDPEQLAIDLMRQASDPTSPLRQCTSCRQAKHARPRVALFSSTSMAGSSDSSKLHTHSSTGTGRTPLQQDHISEVWKLRLGLIRAQHLPKKRLHSGRVGLIETADPFVTFDIPGQQQQISNIIINTLNPEWKEEFVFDVNTLGTVKIGDGIFDGKQELVLRVFYWDADSKNDFVGEVRLGLSDLSSFLNTKVGNSSTSTFNIMNEGRPVIGKDSEPATVTLFLNASKTMKSGGESVSMVPDTEQQMTQNIGDLRGPGSVSVSVLVLNISNITDKRHNDPLECTIRLLYPSRQLDVATVQGTWDETRATVRMNSSKGVPISGPFKFDLPAHLIEHTQIEVTVWEELPIEQQRSLQTSTKGFLGEAIVNVNRLHEMAKQQLAKQDERKVPETTTREILQEFEFSCKAGWTYKPVRTHVTAKISLRFGVIPR